MTATMQDVARLAGVSVKTVSNVVNGYPYIRETTKEKVLLAISELDYQMNVSARSLRSGKTGMIGLAVPELSLPYFAELADSVIEYAESVGLNVLIEQTGANPEREKEVLHGARRNLTDGLIFSPLELGPEDVAEFKVNYPLVLLGERVFNAEVDHVTMDNIEAAKAATNHLLAQGCKRIAVVGAHEGEVVGSAQLRTEGYIQAIKESDVELDPKLIREAGLWHRSTGAQAIFDLLEEGVEFDAVFALNDAMALGVLYALQVSGKSIPGDVKVIGFDDVEEARFSYPTLSSVEPGKLQIARTAVDLLKDRIASADLQAAPRRVVADFELSLRESSK